MDLLVALLAKPRLAYYIDDVDFRIFDNGTDSGHFSYRPDHLQVLEDCLTTKRFPCLSSQDSCLRDLQYIVGIGPRAGVSSSLRKYDMHWNLLILIL